jgi:hypothetical protein
MRRAFSAGRRLPKRYRLLLALGASMADVGSGAAAGAEAHFPANVGTYLLIAVTVAVWGVLELAGVTSVWGDPASWLVGMGLFVCWWVPLLELAPMPDHETRPTYAHLLWFAVALGSVMIMTGAVIDPGEEQWLARRLAKEPRETYRPYERQRRGRF